jgi:DHA1 family multidrug resistance protein-like MFS transporter
MDHDNIPAERNPAGIYKIVRILKSRDESRLWKKNLIYITFAQFIAMVGMSGVFPFLSLFVRQLGITDPEQERFWSGMVFAGPYFSSVIATPIWGALGDKYGRKPMIQRAIIGLAFAVFLQAFSQNVYQLFFFRFVQGALSGMIAASLSFISANTPENRSGFAIGFLQSSIAAGNILGPLLGGIVADVSGIRPVFVVVAVLCMISALFVSVFVKEMNLPKRDKSGLRLIDNFRFALKQRNLVIILSLIMLSQLALGLSIPIFTFFVEKLNAPAKYLATITGLLFGVLGLFNIIFSPYWGRKNDSKGWKSILRINSAAAGVIVAAHVLVPSYVYLFPLRAAAGIFIGGIIPSLYTALNKKAPAEKKGGIMGLASASTLMGSLIAFLTSGFISSRFGLPSIFLISGAIFLIVAFFPLAEKPL